MDKSQYKPHFYRQPVSERVSNLYFSHGSLGKQGDKIRNFQSPPKLFYLKSNLPFKISESEIRVIGANPKDNRVGRLNMNIIFVFERQIPTQFTSAA